MNQRQRHRGCNKSRVQLQKRPEHRAAVVDIWEYLAQRNAQIIAENTATLEEIYSFWTVTMRDQALKQADRLKASELLSKALTQERARNEERAAAGMLNPFDSLTDEELRRLSAFDDGLE